MLTALKAGPWLFGWYGGLDHFSWVRFNFVNATQGSIDVLDATCVTCIGYWLCQGQGLFSADPMTSSVILQLPQGCNNQAHTLVFSMLMPPPGMVPPKAILQASVTDNGNAIMGFQYPPAQCDAQFTMCADPFQ